MKIQKTYSELFTFNSVGGTYLQRHAENKENKLAVAIKNFSKQLTKIFEGFNDEKDNLQLDHCVVDPTTKIILKDAQGVRQYTVEGEKALKKALKEFEKTKIECHARIPSTLETSLIEELSEIEKEAFSEIVIPKQEIEKEE